MRNDPSNSSIIRYKFSNKQLRNHIVIEIFPKICQNAANLIERDANQPMEMLKFRKISRFICDKEVFVLSKKNV